MDELVADLVAAHEEIVRVPVRLTKRETEQAIKSFFVRTQLCVDTFAENPKAGITQLGSSTNSSNNQGSSGSSGTIIIPGTNPALTSQNRHLIHDPLAAGFQPPFFADFETKTSTVGTPLHGTNPVLMRNLWCAFSPAELALLNETSVAVLYAPGQKIYGRNRATGELSEVQVGCISNPASEYGGGTVGTPGPITQNLGISIPAQQYQLSAALTAPTGARYLGIVLYGAVDEFIQFGEGRCATRLGIGSLLNPDLYFGDTWAQQTGISMGVAHGDTAAAFVTSPPGTVASSQRSAAPRGSGSLAWPGGLLTPGAAGAFSNQRSSLSMSPSTAALVGPGSNNTCVLVLHVPLPVVAHYAREGTKFFAQHRDTPVSSSQAPFAAKFLSALTLSQWQVITDAAFRLAPKLWQGGPAYLGAAGQPAGVGMPSIRTEMYRRTLQVLSEGGQVSPSAAQELQAVQRQYGITTAEHEAAMFALGLSEEDWNRFKEAWLTAKPSGKYGRRASLSGGAAAGPAATDLRARNNDMLIRQLHRDMYARALEVFLEDGVITAEERVEIERMRAQYALTEADHDQALAQLGRTRAEYDKMVELGMNAELQSGKGAISGTEEKDVSLDPTAADAIAKTEASRAAREKAALATSLALTRERANQLEVYKRVLSTFLADNELPPAVVSEIEFVRSQCHLSLEDHNQCLAELGFTPEQYNALVEAGADADYLSRLDRSSVVGGANVRLRELTMQNRLVEKERNLIRQLEEERRRSNKYLQNSLARTVQLENARRLNTELQSKIMELEKEIEIYRSRDQESGQSYVVMRKSMEAMLAEIEGYRERERKLEEQLHNANVELTRQSTMLVERYQAQIREIEAISRENEEKAAAQTAHWRGVAEQLEKVAKRAQRLNRKEVEELQRELQSYKDLVAEISGVNAKRLQSVDSHESELQAQLTAAKNALRELTEECDELRLKLEHETKRNEQLERGVQTWAEARTKLETELQQAYLKNKELTRIQRDYKLVVKYLTATTWKKVFGARRALFRIFQSVSQLVSEFIRDVESASGPTSRTRGGSSTSNEEEVNAERRQRELKLAQAKEETLLGLCVLTEDTVQELVAMFDSYRKYIVEWKNISQEFFHRSMELAKERETTSASLNHATQAIHAMLEEDNLRAKQVQELLGRAVDVENTRKETALLRRRVRELEEANKKLQIKCQALQSTSAALQELVTPYSISVPEYLLKNDKGPALPPYLSGVDSGRRSAYDALVSSDVFKNLQRQNYRDQSVAKAQQSQQGMLSEVPSTARSGVPPVRGENDSSALIQGHLHALSERGKINSKELMHLTKSVVTYLKPNLQTSQENAPAWKRRLQVGLDADPSPRRHTSTGTSHERSPEERPLANAGARGIVPSSTSGIAATPRSHTTNDTKGSSHLHHSHSHSHSHSQQTQQQQQAAADWAATMVYSLPSVYSEITLETPRQ